MAYKTKLLGQVFQFDTVKEVLAKANEEKSGDILAGIAASSAMERAAAKQVLAEMPLSELRENPAAPYEADEITRLNQDGVNEVIYGGIRSWTVGELREWLLDYRTAAEDIRRVSRALTAEMIAAAAKLMTNLDLVYAASRIRLPAHCNTTIGLRGRLATRLQPNHTTDNVEGVTASVFEGLSYGCGDALIGLNPVNDTAAGITGILKRFDEIKRRFEIPTQICVLGHITTQLEALRNGAPCDMIFQSIAGSEKGNAAFGFTTGHILEAKELLARQGTGTGPNVLYFETGQGSELSSDSHYGADQVTMEARCYAYARVFEPFMVNTVVGFIGPEYLFDGRQVIRAGLEDHFMGKLSGLPMGCDCCYTNHMMAEQNDIENLSMLLAQAGVNYILGVPAGDDIMLNYQTNAYHDVQAIRETLGLRPIAEFERWLEKMGIMENGRLTERAGDPTIFV
jgi:ethanolamine ammonia-lyase large subunit